MRCQCQLTASSRMSAGGPCCKSSIMLQVIYAFVNDQLRFKLFDNDPLLSGIETLTGEDARRMHWKCKDGFYTMFGMPDIEAIYY